MCKHLLCAALIPGRGAVGGGGGLLEEVLVSRLHAAPHVLAAEHEVRVRAVVTHPVQLLRRSPLRSHARTNGVSG